LSVMNGPMTHHRGLTVAAMGLSDDESTAAVGYGDGTVSTWNTSTGLEPTAQDVLPPLPSGDSALVDMALSPDGELIADLRETYDGRVTWGRPFDPAGPLAEVSLQGEWISAALFSVDDIVLVSSAPLPFAGYPARLMLMDTRGVPRASYTFPTTAIQFHQEDPSHNYLLTRTAAGEYRAATTWETEQQVNTGGQGSGGYLTWRPPDPPASSICTAVPTAPCRGTGATSRAPSAPTSITSACGRWTVAGRWRTGRWGPTTRTTSSRASPSSDMAEVWPCHNPPTTSPETSSRA